MRKPKNNKSGKKQLDRIEHKEDVELKKIGRLEHEVEEIEKALKKPKKKVLRKIDFKQEKKKMPTDFTIVAGTPGTFTAQLTPPNGLQAPGTVPQWSASDSSVTLSASSDGLNLTSTPPATFTGPSFDLTVSAQSADPSVGTVSKTHTITVQPAPQPSLASIDFVQNS